ncbi:MAG: hypothetical protein SPE56_00555 [Prevotella sp.]|nr:hypothetical protein [Prevotella sp.]
MALSSVAVKAQTTKVTDYGFQISAIGSTNGAFYKPGLTFPVSGKYYVPLLGIDNNSNSNSPVCHLSLSDVDSIVIHYSNATPSGKKLQLRPICKDNKGTIGVYVELNTDVSTPQTFKFKFKSNTKIAACDSLMNCVLVNVSAITIDSAYYVMSDGSKMPVVYPTAVQTLVSNYATAPVTLFVKKRYAGFQLMQGSSAKAETCAASDGITHYIINVDKSLTSDLFAFKLEAGSSANRTAFSGETTDFVYSGTDIAKFYVRHISKIPTTGAQIGWITINSITGYKGCVSLDASLETNASTLSGLKSGSAYAVTVSRSVTANQWTGMVLPYAMTRQQLETVFGTDVQVATFTGATTSGDNTTLNFTTTTDAIAAGTPFLLYATQAATSLPLQYGETTATINSVTSDGFTFTGTFDANTSLSAGTVYVATGNQLKTISDDGTIAGFRAYIVPNTTSPAKTFTLSVDATTTAISNVSVAPARQRAGVYSLDGRCMGLTTEGLRPGVYIKNGRKFIVK